MTVYFTVLWVELCIFNRIVVKGLDAQILLKYSTKSSINAVSSVAEDSYCFQYFLTLMTWHLHLLSQLSKQDWVLSNSMTLQQRSSSCSVRQKGLYATDEIEKWRDTRPKESFCSSEPNLPHINKGFKEGEEEWVILFTLPHLLGIELD